MTNDYSTEADLIGDALDAVYLKKTDVDIDVGSFSELQSLISAASTGSVVVLKKSYKNSGSETEVYLPYSITIVGNGHTIDADGQSRIFNISQGSSSSPVTVNLIGLNFVNGRGGQYQDGGSIYVSQYNSVNVFDCSFSNSQVNNNHGGGAIYCDEAATIINCTFNNNTAGSGGAIKCFTNYSMSIKNCVFKDNSATTGNDVSGGPTGLVIYNCETTNANLYNTTNKKDINSDSIVDNLTTADATKVLSAKQGKQLEDTKQALLVSGTNIKTINNNSLLGSGNINISGGGGDVDIVTEWETTLSDEKVPSEKLVKNSLDDKAASNHTHDDRYYTESEIDTALSGKANSSHTHTKSEITDFPTIPSKISDLTNDSDFIETSSTSGLIKNDGSIDESDYITSSDVPTKTSDLTNDGSDGNDTYVEAGDLGAVATSNSYNDLDNTPAIPSKISDLTNDSDFIETSSTSGLVKNDGTIDTSTYLTQMKIGTTSGLPVKTGSSGVLEAGAFGTSAGQFAEGNHSHSGMLTTSDIYDGLDSSATNKALSAKQGKALADLIGDAITYINQ